MTEGAGTAVPCARGGAKGQADGGYGPRRQIDALLRWPEAEGHEVPLGRTAQNPMGPGVVLAMPSPDQHEDGAERIALLLRVSSEDQRERETIEIQREFPNVRPAP